MSIFQKIGKLFTKAVGAVGTVVGIGRQMAPVVAVVRELSPDLDRFVDKLEAGVATGGVAFDDFLDRNVETLGDMKGFFRETQAWAAAGEVMVDKALEVSQTTTPDIVDLAEGEALAVTIDVFRARTMDLATVASPEFEAKLVAME